ncbi:FkbM family methyltransferase [Colwellia sp. 1_MG-2023]|uniref:FkbM family methyltransferase n=1 Tax=Colwellia sp. 1_MG-2023 TaxID=3062649 RepID=UPI0026E23757|nr:FkbM family methyltransferase [Colwellia sp. 1_MG-2023]MDO6444378.1 FkbM family methyltransferase [Colwellia sp. 1_MG-2023]
MDNQTNKKFIYGASYLGIALAELFDEQHIEYEFIDAYAPRDRVLGKYMFRPEEITAKDKTEATIYIAVLLPPLAPDVDEVLYKELSNMGFANLIPPFEVMAIFPEALKKVASDGLLWRKPDDEDYINQQAFETVIQYFDDDRSKNLLENIYNFRKNCDVKNYIKTDFGEEYFPENINLSAGFKALHVLDCGAFDGDTITQFFNKLGNSIISYKAFEPELENYNQLVKVATNVKKNYAKASINCFPMGVGNTNKVIRFSSGDGAASHISDEGDCEIFIVKLDDSFACSEVNLIKIDVEGADLDVINGASNIIKQQKPNIAVSCYHHPAHIWQIPQALKALNPNYQMYLRQHGHHGFELTLYCIDKSRINNT